MYTCTLQYSPSSHKLSLSGQWTLRLYLVVLTVGASGTFVEGVDETIQLLGGGVAEVCW